MSEVIHFHSEMEEVSKADWSKSHHQLDLKPFFHDYILYGKFQYYGGADYVNLYDTDGKIVFSVHHNRDIWFFTNESMPRSIAYWEPLEHGWIVD